MSPFTISGINHLPPEEKRAVYMRIIPPELLRRFDLSPALLDAPGSDLVQINAEAGSTVAEMKLFHRAGFDDPVLYGQIADTLNGQVHVLLYVLNNPASPRFDVDRMPDGSSTQFATASRNLPAEEAALRYGLAPGQVRAGLRMLGPAIRTFEQFVESLGHELYFAEPLHYHSAILFERYGFSYERGRTLMERIQKGFEPGGELLPRLDGSTPFRQPGAALSIRLRSWAIHDGLLGEPFNNVTMYKRVGKMADVCTCPGCEW
ncbi:MAG TPA: hypothetical protein VF498_00870 [Anaerolineales bacterium]